MYKIYFIILKEKEIKKILSYFYTIVRLTKVAIDLGYLTTEKIESIVL